MSDHVFLLTRLVPVGVVAVAVAVIETLPALTSACVIYSSTRVWQYEHAHKEKQTNEGRET